MSRMSKNEKIVHDLNAFASVEKYLRQNKGNGAIVGSKIAYDCNLKNDVEVRYCVNYLRNIGVPVCSNRHGYWLANNDEEILDTVKMLKARAFSILAAAYRMQNSLVDQDDFFDDIYH